MLPKAPNTLLRFALVEFGSTHWYSQLREIKSSLEIESRLTAVGQKVCFLWLSGRLYMGPLVLGDPYSAPSGVLIYDLTRHPSHSDRQSFTVANLSELAGQKLPDGVCLEERDELFRGHWMFEEISAGDLALVNS